MIEKSQVVDGGICFHCPKCKVDGMALKLRGAPGYPRRYP
jgi:hypothetical protein